MPESKSRGRMRAVRHFFALLLEPILWNVHPSIARSLKPTALRVHATVIIDRALAKRPKQFRTTLENGLVLSGSTDDLIRRFIYVFGVWEPAISAWLVDHLRDGDTFVDVGANVGWYSMIASRRVGQEGSIIAYEAVPSIAEELRSNVALNGCDVDVRNQAVGADIGEVEVFRAGSNNVGSSGLSADSHATSEGKVPLTSLDLSIDSLVARQIRALKIDVEGFEAEVIDGARTVLSLMPEGSAVLVEVAPQLAGADRVGEMLSALRSSGFTTYSIPNTYAARDYARGSLRPVLTPIVGLPLEQTDLVCIKG